LTKTLLYETAALTMTASSSGACGVLGPRSAAGILTGHCTGLESRFVGEVVQACAGMTREDANEIVVWLVEQYKDELDKRPIGKPFDEIYDVDRLQPKEEWQMMYENVKSELEARGMIFS
jgi:methylamine--corrinoid protein Co-methyltransferase